MHKICRIAFGTINTPKRTRTTGRFLKELQKVFAMIVYLLFLGFVYAVDGTSFYFWLMAGICGNYALKTTMSRPNENIFTEF